MITVVICILLACWAVYLYIGIVREKHEGRRKWKELYDQLGEKEFRASLRRVLIEREVDKWMP